RVVERKVQFKRLATQSGRLPQEFVATVGRTCYHGIGRSPSARTVHAPSVVMSSGKGWRRHAGEFAQRGNLSNRVLVDQSNLTNCRWGNVESDRIGRDRRDGPARRRDSRPVVRSRRTDARRPAPRCGAGPDRKSTRLNSSHVKNSYAVFCLKKKKQLTPTTKNHRSRSKHRRPTN